MMPKLPPDTDAADADEYVCGNVFSSWPALPRTRALQRRAPSARDRAAVLVDRCLGALNKNGYSTGVGVGLMFAPSLAVATGLRATLPRKTWGLRS